MALPLRFHARFPCRIRVRLRCPSRRAPLDAQAENIGMGGALVRTRIAFSDRRVEVEIPAGDETLVLSASIARCDDDPGDPSAHIYALSFEPRFSERHKLLRLVDRIRREK